MRLQWFKNHTIQMRLALGFGMAGLALVAVPLITYLVQSNGDIRTARLEQAGLAPANALMKVVQLMQQHRGLSSNVLSGNTTMKAQRVAKQIEVDKAVEAFDAMVKSHIHDPALAGIWSRIVKRWMELASSVSSHSMVSRESFVGHTTLIGDNLKLLDLLLDYFGLSLDPSADSSHLIRGTLVYLPKLTESLGQLRARGSLYLTTKQITFKKRIALLGLIDTADKQHAQMAQEIGRAMAVSPRVKAALDGLVLDSAARAQKATHVARTQIVDTRILSYASSDYFAIFTEIIDGQLKLFSAAMSELDTLLQSRIAGLRSGQAELFQIRIAGLQSGQVKVVGFIGVVIACAVWLGTAFTRQTGRISRLLAVANEQLPSEVREQATSLEEIAT